MVKRKVTYTSADLRFDLVAKRKKTPWRTPADKKGTIDTSTPEALVQSLLGKTSAQDFFAHLWEQKALHVKRCDGNFYGELFTLPIVRNVIQTNEFSFLLDVNVSTYDNGHKKEFFEENGKVTLDALERLMSVHQATFQFCHPQRYINELWNILEKLETYFGCLWSAHAFLTPSGKQGSAPHCDDVENFILQLEGVAEWKLFKPMVELSRGFTQDVLEESLGDPILVVTLEPGDLLYFPRGVIYQSKASDAGHTTHVVLSTYLQNTWADFMCHAASQAVEKALEDDVDIRRGLPVNYRSYLGTARNLSAYVAEVVDGKASDKDENSSNMNDSRVAEFKEQMRSRLSKLVEHIDVNKAADMMCRDFVIGRLPPYEPCPVPDSEASAEGSTERTDDENIAQRVSSEGDTPEQATVPTSETTEGVGTESEVPTSITTTSTVPTDVTTVCDVSEASNASVRVGVSPAPQTIGITDKIKIKYPDHMRVLYVNPEDDDGDDFESDVSSQTDIDDDDDDDDEATEETTDVVQKVKTLSTEDDDDEDADLSNTEPQIEVLHSLFNDRYSHMGFSVFPRVCSLKFDVSYAHALVALRSSNEFITVKELPLDTNEEKLVLASRLAADGLIQVVSV